MRQVTLNQHAGFFKNGTAIELGNNSMLMVSGGRTIQGLLVQEEFNGAAEGNGTLIFTGGNSGLEGIAVGKGNSIHELRIEGAIELHTERSIKATMINFTGEGTLKTAADVTGIIDNISGVINNGTLQLTGDRAITINGNIGIARPLKEIKFEVAGEVTLNGIANAETFSINKETAVVTARGLMAGKVNFTKAGMLNANNGVTGNIDFAGKAGTLNAGALITGNVDSTGDPNGTLNFTGANSGVTGKIGNANPLHEIIVNNGATATLSKAPILNATTVNVGEAGRASTLILDASANNMDLMPNVGNSINFLHDDSLIKFVSGDVAGRTFTLQNSTIGGVGHDIKGRVELNAVRGDLTIAGNGLGNTLGVANNHRLKELINGIWHGYDANISKKYLGYQGTLKVRANF